MNNVRDGLKRLAERVRQSYYTEQLGEYDVLQFVQDVHEIDVLISKYEKCQELVDIIFKALTSNSKNVYSRIFEDKAECGWITQEECDRILAEIECWNKSKKQHTDSK